MKNTLISIAIAATLIITACQKNDMMNNTFRIDTNKYENILSVDYSNALLNHNMLITTNVLGDTDNAHHLGTSDTSTMDTLYYKMMFNRYDSLFSQHFYEFCKDIMENSGMMSTSDGMMGNNGHMMGGNGSKMNECPMGDTVDMSEMMGYMDSLHLSTGTMMDPDYMNTDSLLYNQMAKCNMMSLQADSVVSIYGNMQILRKNHKKFHRN
jgi:hypothetical protein